MTFLSHQRIFEEKSVGTESGDGIRTIPVMAVRLGDGCLAAVPLAEVARIDEIDAKRLDGDGRHVWVWIGGRLVPVLGLSTKDGGARSVRHTVLLFCDGGRMLGLAVDRVLDVVTARMAGVRAVLPNSQALPTIRVEALFDEAYAGLDLSAQIVKPASRYRRWCAHLCALFARTAIGLPRRSGA